MNTNTPTPCTITHHDFGLVISPERETATPVIITVQHNGHTPRVFDELFIPRNGNWESDMRSAHMAKEIFRQSVPHSTVVWNTIPRKFLETNVFPEENAFADPRMRKYYDSFHGTVASLVESGINQFGKDKVLILDMHVFERQPDYAPTEGYDAILGTRNRDTVLSKSTNFPFSNLDKKLARSLADKKVEVFLPQENPVQPSGRPDAFNGGYLVAHHAEINPHINAAIQIETRSQLNRADHGMSAEMKKRRCTLIETFAGFITETYSDL